MVLQPLPAECIHGPQLARLGLLPDALYHGLPQSPAPAVRRLKLTFDRQQSHDVDQEALPRAGLRIAVELDFLSISLGRPEEVAVLVARDAERAAGGHALIHEVRHLAGDLR